MVGHETAELFDGHLDRHRRDQVLLSTARPGRPRTAATRPAFRRLAADAAAELHHGVAAVGLGHQQRAVGAAEHRFGRVAGLNFRHAEAGRHRAAAIFACGIWLSALRICSARRAAVALSQSAQSTTNSSPP